MARPAPVLNVVLGDVNTHWPTRRKAKDGWIGDAKHQARKSDHNPDSRGIVHARDFDARDIDGMLLVAALIRHPSTQYVIHNRTIWSRSTGFAPHRYTGDDPHTEHIHWSIQYTAAAENSSIHIVLGGRVSVSHPAPSGPGGIAPMPVLRRGSKHSAVRTVQGALHRAGHPVPIDGDFGRVTESAVRSFQVGRRLTVDGTVGPRTWAALAQACLNWHGFSCGTVDGIVGPSTVAAIRAMQRARGITVDGILGPKSWAQLT